MIFRPRHYQQALFDYILQRLASGLVVDMGLGKTVVALSVCHHLKYNQFLLNRTLIVAPKLVAETVWDAEIEKWDHLKGLTISKVLGTEKQRIHALRTPADIYIINFQNISWLLAFLGGAFPFDMLIIDELSGFKNPGSQRFKDLKRIRPLVNRVIGLTGTFAPNSLVDIWSQVYLLDQGQRLGKTITSYKEAYFSRKHGGAGQFGAVEIRKDINQLSKVSSAEREIYNRISDICISMKSEDYLELPPFIEQEIKIDLPPDIRKKYFEFEKQCVLELLAKGEETVINAINSGALNTKLAQFANGAVYSDDGSYWVEVHKEKLYALEEEVEYLNGKPCIVWYWFKHDKERILKHLARFNPVEFNQKNIARWNRGELTVMVGHSQSGGHGLNLQQGGNYEFWFAHTWSSEFKRQASKRLHRPGQGEAVISKKIVCSGTIDEKMIARVAEKVGEENKLTDAISYAKQLIDKYRKTLTNA